MNRLSKLCALCAALLVSTFSFAQSTLLATLCHEGKLSAYSGIDALKEAVEAAVDGDVITLTYGQFNAADINKAITVRGAGSVEDTLTTLDRTRILKNFMISPSIDAPEGQLKFEGLYFDGEIKYESNIRNAQFTKCNIYRLVNFDNNVVSSSFEIRQCQVRNVVEMYKECHALCVNSYIWSSSTKDDDEKSYFEIWNCVLRAPGVRHSIIYNSVVCENNGSYYLAKTNQAYYSAGWSGANGNIFGYVTGHSNYVIEGDARWNFFKTFNSRTSPSASETFELADGVKGAFVGSDGTEIGMQGGSMPYETAVKSPMITKFNVAKKSTDEGKLSVDIQVEVAK